MSPLVQSSNGNGLADHVRAELRRVEGIDPAALLVSVVRGQVRLDGRVDTWAQREGVLRAVRGVKEVRGIDASRLRVRVPDGRPFDISLGNAAQGALRWHLAVPHGAVEASAHGGTIVLEGTVDGACQREAAEAAVRPLEGVTGILNRIRIRGEEP